VSSALEVFYENAVYKFI